MKTTVPELNNGFLDPKPDLCWLPDFRIVTPSRVVYFLEVKPSFEFVDFKKFRNSLYKQRNVAVCTSQPRASITMMWQNDCPNLVSQFPANINDIWRRRRTFEANT